MLLKDVRDFLKEINSSEKFGFQNFYVGTLDNKKENSILVRPLNYGNIEDKYNWKNNKVNGLKGEYQISNYIKTYLFILV